MELMLLIVNVLLKTLNIMKNHGINIVIVNHGSVIQQIMLLINVNNLLTALTTVITVLMSKAVTIVLKITIIMVITVNTKILLLYACQVVILVLMLLLVTNVLLDIWMLMVSVKWI
jgi:hypothetical protein